MSFGFSVGDFVAVSKLIKDISTCLRDVGGSKAEYQELLRELECLRHALLHLDKLQNSNSSSTTLDSIKYAALSCRHPLERFLAQIHAYDTSLGVWGKKGVGRSAPDKLRSGLSQKEELRKLQSYLGIHMGTINILLAEHGLEQVNLASEEAAAQQVQIRQSLDETRDMIQKISGGLETQNVIVKRTQDKLAQLFDTMTGDFMPSWRSLVDIVTKIWIFTEQTYTMVFEIRSTMLGPDTRWTHFQAPMIVEDALGFKFPVPSEYDFDLLDAVIRHRFKTGPGALDVEAGNYEYIQTKNSSAVLSKSSRLLPGTSITMAIIVRTLCMTDEVCPIPNCHSLHTTASPRGGRVCRECTVWYTQTQQNRRPPNEVLVETPQVPSQPDNQSADMTEPKPRPDPAPSEEEVAAFRNIRLSHLEWCQSATASSPQFRHPLGKLAKALWDSRYEVLELTARLYKDIVSNTTVTRAGDDEEKLHDMLALNERLKNYQAYSHAFHDQLRQQGYLLRLPSHGNLNLRWLEEYSRCSE